MTRFQTARALLLVGLLPLAACNANIPNAQSGTIPQPMAGVPSITSQDQKFAQQAATGDMFEIKSSQLALQRSRNPAVRRYAQMMVDEHTMTSQKLMTVAAQKGIALPNDVEPTQQRTLADLQGARGSFDRQYMAAQVSSHRDTQMIMRTQISTGTDPDLTAAARETLPLVERHLAQAERMRMR